MAQIILDSNNNLIQGDFDNATINNRTKFKTTTTNATTNVYAVPNGSATSAGFTVTNAADPTNASKLTIATNGSTDTQIISGVNGSGTYLPLSFYTNNALAMQIDTNGYTLINTTSNPDSYRLLVNGGSSTEVIRALSSSTTGTGVNINNTSAGGYNWNIFSGGSGAALAPAGSLIFRDSTNGVTRMYIGPSGRTYIPNAYTETTGNSANLFVDTDGRLIRATSSLKYKTDIKDATHGLNEVMQLRSVTYKGKEDGEKVFGGLIAEEVHAAGLTEFVQYAQDGTPDALAYGNMVSLLTKAIQEQQAIINELKTRIEALESK